MRICTGTSGSPSRAEMTHTLASPPKRIKSDCLSLPQMLSSSPPSPPSSWTQQKTSPNTSSFQKPRHSVKVAKGQETSWGSQQVLSIGPQFLKMTLGWYLKPIISCSFLIVQSSHNNPFLDLIIPLFPWARLIFLDLKRQQEMKTSESIQGPGIMRSWASKIMPNFASLNSLSDESIKLRWRQCPGHLGK